MEKKSWTQKSTIVFLIASLVGSAILLWSAADWFALMSGLRQYSSFCSINQYWDCDRASMSPMGSFWDIPVGIFSVCWFVVAIFLGFSHSRFKLIFRSWLILGLVAIAIFGGFLLFQLKTGCIICLASYVCILTTVISGWKLSRREGQLLGMPFLSGALVVILLSLASFAFAQRSGLSGKIPLNEFEAWFESLPSATVTAPAVMKKGPSDAKIKVYEFSDFGCPFCALAAGIMMPYLSLQPDVEINYFPFPLDAACNPLMQRTVHGGSCDWSKAALCAHQQDKGWMVHDGIFRMVRNGETLPPVSQAVSLFSLDQAPFDTCMQGEDVAHQLRESIEAANSLKVSSTPTFVINGRLLRGFIPLPILRRLIEELRKTPG